MRVLERLAEAAGPEYLLAAEASQGQVCRNRLQVDRRRTAMLAPANWRPALARSESAGRTAGPVMRAAGAPRSLAASVGQPRRSVAVSAYAYADCPAMPPRRAGCRQASASGRRPTHRRQSPARASTRRGASRWLADQQENCRANVRRQRRPSRNDPGQVGIVCRNPIRGASNGASKILRRRKSVASLTCVLLPAALQAGG